MECGFDRALAAWFAHCKSGQLWEGLLPSRGIIRPGKLAVLIPKPKVNLTRFHTKEIDIECQPSNMMGVLL